MSRKDSGVTKLQTQKAIFAIKDAFERRLAQWFRLTRVTVPLIVDEESGLNDGLEWDESKTPVQFKAAGKNLQVVQAATKWKRTALRELDLKDGEGIITDMRAIRKNETPDALHSLYVDQWDWERVIPRVNRTLEFLKGSVNVIYTQLKQTEKDLHKAMPELGLKKVLPPKIHFISAKELYEQFPLPDPRDREAAILKKHPAVFIYSIGHELPDGSRHELRAPDYDDWNLNGDLVVWNTVTQKPHELSSMGIRVDETSIVEQLKITDQLEMFAFQYHRDILDGELPLSIGGGIGQSRLYMLLLGKEHIKEVQESVW